MLKANPEFIFNARRKVDRAVERTWIVFRVAVCGMAVRLDLTSVFVHHRASSTIFAWSAVGTGGPDIEVVCSGTRRGEEIRGTIIRRIAILNRALRIRSAHKIGTRRSISATALCTYRRA